jgi:hypothetical protein
MCLYILLQKSNYVRVARSREKVPRKFPIPSVLLLQNPEGCWIDFGQMASQVEWASVGVVDVRNEEYGIAAYGIEADPALSLSTPMTDDHLSSAASPELDPKELAAICPFPKNKMASELAPGAIVLISILCVLSPTKIAVSMIDEDADTGDIDVQTVLKKEFSLTQLCIFNWFCFHVRVLSAV